MLVVEDGTGVAGADSFASVEYADEHNAKFGNAAWSNLQEPAKEILLREATRYLRLKYQPGFTAWPLVTYPDRLKALKDATSELAFIARGGPLMPTKTRGKKKIKIGPLEIEYDADTVSGERFTVVGALLSPLFVPLVAAPVYAPANHRTYRC